MSVATKLGLSLISLSAIAVPGVWMTVTAEPNSTTSADDSVSEYQNKFGEYFKHHFVNAKEGKNQSWWDWSFKYRWQADQNISKEEGHFKDVADGSSLRKKCEEIYKKENKELHKDEKVKDEAATWRYCSLEGQKPITLSESSENKETSGTGKIKNSKQKDLISTKDPRNNKFWEIQGKAFFKKTDGLGSKAEKDGSIFKALYESKDDTSQKSLKSACEKVYEKETTDANDQKDALMFCSLLIKDS